MLLGLASSYSWYDIIVQAVSQDGSGGIRYSSDWTFDVVLTAEDSKATLYKYRYILFNKTRTNWRSSEFVRCWNRWKKGASNILDRTSVHSDQRGVGEVRYLLSKRDRASSAK